MYTNSELTYEQREVIDAKSKRGFWLFDLVTVGATTYRWTDFSSKVWDGNTYTFKIVGMSDLEEIDNGAETGIISISNLNFEIENAGNVLSPSDLEGATVTVRLILGAKLAMAFAGADGVSFEEDAAEVTDYHEIQAFSWTFKVITAAHTGEQSIKLECENWLLSYLRGDYPNTRLHQDEFPDDTDMDGTCVPEIWGAAYIPVRSVYSSTKRYYCLGPSGVTYTITEVRAPKDYGSTVYAAASYTFTDATLTGRSTATYNASEFKIVSVGGTAVNGLFPQGGRFLDALCKYSSSATSSMTNPANVIENILEDFGIPSAKIDDTAKAACAATYTGWGLAWAGGLWYKQDRTELLSELLIQCNMQIIPRSTLKMRVRDKTSVLTIEEVDMLLEGADDNGNGGQNSYKVYPRNRQEEKDSLHVAYRPTGEPCDELIKILVPADTTTAKPSSQVLNMPFVHNSQHAQILGTLAAQGLLNVKYDVEWLADPRDLRVEVGDVVTLNNANYGGPVNVRITQRRISKELDLVLHGTVYAVPLKNWADLAPGAITPAVDDSANVVRTVKESYIDPVTGVPAAGQQVQGTIYLAPGADINLKGSDDDPALVKWTGSTYLVTAGFNTTGSVFSIQAGSDGDVDLVIGDDWAGGFNSRFSHINLMATDYIVLKVQDTEYQFWSTAFQTSTNKTTDCGHASYAWDDVWADDFQNVADFFLLDSKSDLDAINKIKGSGKIDSRTGLEMIDDTSLPEWLLTKCKKTGQILYDPDGKPYVAIKSIISLLLGAIRELDKKKADK